MARRVDLTEYLRNVRELLGMDPNKFGLMIDRQVQFKVLPGVAGPRATLEPQLWELLVLCLDGHEATPPTLDDATWETALCAAEGEQRLGGNGAAIYPRAAIAVANALATLREVGVYPPPKVR